MSEVNGNMNTDVAPGDTVSWSFGGSNPTGKVEEVKPTDISITTHRGNEVSKSGSEDNPAAKVSINGKPVARQANELNVEKEGPNHDKAGTMTSNSESGNVKPSQEASGEKIAAEKEKKSSGLEPPKGRGKSKSKSPAPPAKKDEKKDEKKDDKKDTEKKEEKASEPKNKEAEKTEDKPAAEKKKPGRKPGTGTGAKNAAGQKKEKTKKRAATEDGEPRRSKRTKA